MGPSVNSPTVVTAAVLLTYLLCTSTNTAAVTTYPSCTLMNGVIEPGPRWKGVI